MSIPAHKSGTAGQIVNPLPAQTLGDYVGQVQMFENEPAGVKLAVDVQFGEAWVQVCPTDGRPQEFTSYDEARTFAMQLRNTYPLPARLRTVA